MKKKLLSLFALCFLSFNCSCKNATFEDSSSIAEEELVVTMIDGDVVEGKEQMDDFYLRTRNGEKLKITINRSYTDSQSTQSNYIIYDGEFYKTDLKVLESDSDESKFIYLNFNEVNPKGIFLKTESYCLSNDPTMTYEKIMNSWLSSRSEDLILDSILIYQIEYCVELQFTNTEVLNIYYNSELYEANLFNNQVAREMVDCLKWGKNPPENYSGRSNSSLIINMKRTLSDEEILIQYLFNFESKVVVMARPAISSTYGQLYAKLTDESINKLEGLFNVPKGN